MISVISFTQNGIRLSKKLADKLAGGEEILLYTKCAPKAECLEAAAVKNVEQSLGDWAKEQMQAGRTLLFIGACGIAVRAIAPNLTDKLHDSPVLVMDEKGNYVIPILSGHYGGANEMAQKLAEALGAVAVITTATDLNRAFAVDLFAKKNDLLIVNKDGIAKVSSKVLAGQKITISIETGHIQKNCRLPEGVRGIPYPPKQYVDVLVTSEDETSDSAILLKPREYAAGIGCRKGKEAEKIETFIHENAKKAGISTEQIFALASIDQKKQEQGLLWWSQKNHVPFLTYTAGQLQRVKGKFEASAFVQEKVGVDNVCERAALKACGPAGRIIYKKHAEDGMTIAIAKREWSVAFDEK